MQSRFFHITKHLVDASARSLPKYGRPTCWAKPFIVGIRTNRFRLFMSAYGIIPTTTWRNDLAFVSTTLSSPSESYLDKGGIRCLLFNWSLSPAEQHLDMVFLMSAWVIIADFNHIKWSFAPFKRITFSYKQSLDVNWSPPPKIILVVRVTFELHFKMSTTISALGFALLACGTYLFYEILWRLYFSPISRFPGPKLAAATMLYELWYELVKGGQYTFKIAELHEEYGQSNRTFLFL